MKVTIFTPTFNRCHLLPRLYISLLNQSYKDFEWVIVDDGSDDDTESYIAELIKDNLINITYFKQDNKGKHIAINKGIDLAKGDLFFIVDSDDALEKFALEFLDVNYEKVISNKLAGIVGRKCYFDGNKIGNDMPKHELICTSFDFRYKYRISGDLAEVFRLDVIKKFKFPESKEKFCPEALVYNRIAREFKMLWIDSNIYQVEYLKDGLSSKIFEIRKRSPINTMLYYKELSDSTVPFWIRCKAIINYWRFSIYNSNKTGFALSNFDYVLSLFLLPFIIGIILKDRF